MLEIFPKSLTALSAPEFLSGGGESGARLRSHDWSRTPLGAAREWPAALRMALRIVLASPSPMALWWGPDGASFHNDACATLLGEQFDAGMGRRAVEVWGESWTAVAPAVDAVLKRGEGQMVGPLVFSETAPGGRPRQVTLSLAPVAGETSIDGVLCSFTDVTAALGLAAQARMAEERRLEAETLREVAMDLASELDLQALVQRVTDLGTRLTGAQFGAFFYNVVNESGESFQLYTLSGAPAEAFSHLGLPRATPIFKPTFMGAGPVRCEDVQRDPRYGGMGPHFGMPKGHLPVRSYLAVPVMTREGTVLGGLFFAHPEPGRFDERSERNALGLAANAAVAFDNAHLYQQACGEIERRTRIEEELRATKDQLAQQVDSLTLLHDLAVRLGGISEREPALQAILEAAAQAQGADMGLIWLHDGTSGALLAQVSHGFDPATLLAFDRVMPGPHGGGAGNAFARGTRYVIEDIAADPAFEPFRASADRAGFRALHSTPIVTRKGDLLGVISVHFREPHVPSQRDMQIADVCARHAADAIEAGRAAEAMRRSDRIFRAMGASIDYGVWTCDALGRNTYVSQSFLDLTGLTQDQCAGHGWMTLLHPDEQATVSREWEKCVASGGQWDMEHRVKGVDGAWHAVLARGVPVRDERGQIGGWAGINLDISRLKQVETELRELDQRKNEFLATLAHELRNPLAPLRNGLEVIRLAGGGGPGLDKARGMMERQLQQMVRLVDDLLDVSRVSRGKIELRREELDVALTLRNAIETSQPLIAERGHELVTDFPSARIVVDGDGARLSQVFGNLLNNAAKYTEPGGRIALAVRIEGAEAVVSVSDNGVGIPANMLSQVFDIFTQVDRSLEKSQGGLGIGLSIARRLVEMHGGTISVASGGHLQGTRFEVRLPARTEALSPPVGASTGPFLAAGAAPRRRVLVADDNEDSAETLSMMLEVIGNDVRVARDGREAVEIAGEYDPDVILLDIGMPRMNGYDACRALRAGPQGAQAYIVALTGWGQEEDKALARDAGFDRHLVKPVDPAILEKLVASVPPRGQRAH